MDSHSRYPMLQPSLSASTSELWSVMSQSFIGMSPASSFTDLNELDVFDPMASTLTPASSETNLQSLEMASERDLKLGNLHRKLSLEFLNSNRRDVESELLNSKTTERGAGKDASSTLLTLKKPLLHSMSTVRSTSPLPGVHTFRRKTEGIETLRSPAVGEVPSDTGVHAAGFEHGLYQSQMESHSSPNVNVYYTTTTSHPSHQMYNTNGVAAYPSQVQYKSSRDLQTMVSVTRQPSRTNLMSFASVDPGCDPDLGYTTVHSYFTPHHSSVDYGAHYAPTGMVLNTRVQHDGGKPHPIAKTQDHHITDAAVNYGRRRDMSGSRYYDPPTSDSMISSAATHGYSNRSSPESADSTPRQFTHRPIMSASSTSSQTHLESHERAQERGGVQVVPDVPAATTGGRNQLQDNQCHICRKTYGRPSTLKTHVRTHLGERPYGCQQCGKSFTQPANLTAHIRIHSGEKPFSCPACFRQFSQSSSLKTHMRTHSGERPYACTICNKSFADSSTLTKHRRIHTGEKPYQCNVCMQHFSQSGNLKRHMKVHMD